MRTFEECRQDHQEALLTYATTLKRNNTESEILRERTCDRAEPRWMAFEGKGNQLKERAWLKTIMYHLHIDDLRCDWYLPVPYPVIEPSGRGPELGSDAWLKNEVLSATIALVTELITDDATSYELTRDGVNFFIAHRFEELPVSEIAAQHGMKPVDVEEAIAKVDAVFRDLFTKALSYEEDDTEGTSFDDCFDAVSDAIEADAFAGALPGVTRAHLTRFRYYYYHHEPTQANCAAHFRCAVGAVNNALQNVRPEFCARWQRVRPDVRADLGMKWQELSQQKAKFLDRWIALGGITEASIRQELEALGESPDRIVLRATQEYETIKQEREQLRQRRSVYQEEYGGQSLTRREPVELFTRRQLFALECSGVALPARQGHPGYHNPRPANRGN